MKIGNVMYAPVQEASKNEVQTPVERMKRNFSSNQEFYDMTENINRRDLEQAVEKFQQAVGIFNKHFKFDIHDGTKRVIVRVIDTRTDEVVNEIPPEKILDMIAQLQDMVGVILDKEA